MDCAEKAFKQAIAIIEDLRAPLPAEEFRTAFLADKLTPYTELVRLCLSNGVDRSAEALDYVERARSRALVDRLGGASLVSRKPQDDFEAGLLAQLEELRGELNWFYNQINRPSSEGPRSVEATAALHQEVRQRETSVLEIQRQLSQHGGSDLSAIHGAPLNIAALQRDLGADTVLVEFFSLDSELLAFVVTGETITVVRGLGHEAWIEAAVQQFRFQVGALNIGSEQMRRHMPQLAARAKHYLSELYDLLLRPLAELLGERRLVVVPHRTLHYVPFHALYDGEQYVIEGREVCYAPSAQVLRYCLARPQPALQRAVLLGVPDSQIPRVRDELAAITPIFPDTTALVDEQATLEALRAYAPSADLLHLACHGTFRPDNPLFSSLQLADGALTVRDAYELDLRCRLVALSACETGVSAVAPGDEIIGLARGFFAAGAPALLVSLWMVDDAIAASLMADLYTRLRVGAGIAESLRAAQLTLLRQNPHPFFWSSFALFGRW
jgi:CHAT domain-containing protein